MKALRGLGIGCAVLLLAGQAYGDAKEDAAKLLVGKWETKQTINNKDITATFGFTKDNKLSLKFSGATDLELKGSYKILDETTIEMTVTIKDKTMTEKQKFKVSKDSLELTGSKDNKTVKFNRIK
jgi:uncharacterized protein (TIGR03066 family)